MKLFYAAVALSLGTLSALAQDQIREQIEVKALGHEEVWQVVSQGETEKICRPADPKAAACPCAGFENADAGKFDIVRFRDGREIDRLNLAPLFGDNFPIGPPGTSWLPPKKPILKLADYDHSGTALEFLLQVDTAPCGKPVVAAIGISRTHPNLHALSSAEQPDMPLTMYWTGWQKLRKGPGPFTEQIWACGDHGADTQLIADFSAADGVIHFRTGEGSCPLS